MKCRSMSWTMIPRWRRFIRAGIGGAGLVCPFLVFPWILRNTLQEEQAKEEKDIAPSICWDPTMNAPNLKNKSGTQHQQQEEDIDMMPLYLHPLQSFVVAAQYENRDLDPSEYWLSWVLQGIDESDAIGSSGGGDNDNNNNKKKRIPKTTRILLDISSVGSFYSEQTTE